MKYTYLDMAEMDFRYTHLSFAFQMLKNKNYGTKRVLSATDTHVLDCINKNSGITLTQLSEYMFRTKSTLSAVVNTLLEDELIKKEQNEKDKRLFGLILTEKGKDVLEKHYAYNEKLYKIISDYIIDKYGEEYLDAYYDIMNMHIKIAENSLKSGNEITEELLEGFWNL